MDRTTILQVGKALHHPLNYFDNSVMISNCHDDILMVENKVSTNITVISGYIQLTVELL
jgi:hypothetical protein